MSRGICLWTVLAAVALGGAPAADARVARRAPAQHVQVAPETAPLPAESLIEKEPLLDGRNELEPQTLNSIEMLSLVKRYATEIAGAVLMGERHREEAVRQRDAIKLSCIQDRLSSMKLMRKLSNDRIASTERPAVRADELSLRHEFRGMEMAHQRVLQLQRELVECAGESLEVTKDGDSTQVGSPTSAATDPAGNIGTIPPADRPPPASTFM